MKGGGAGGRGKEGHLTREGAQHIINELLYVKS